MIDEPGFCGDLGNEDGEEPRQLVRLAHDPADMLSGVTDPCGVIGNGLRNEAMKWEDRETDLSATGVEQAFFGVAGLNPISVKRIKAVRYA